MILRRVMKHVTDQNWFAVGIDFVIVVVGVFMGFQVQQWATNAGQRESEKGYLNRLHGEVVQLTQDRFRYIMDVQDNQLALTSVVAVLQNQSDRQALTDAECEAIAESHIYSNPTADLPTITELLSTGRFDALQAKGVRAAITRFNQSALRGGDVIDAVNRNIFTLARGFPKLIQLETIRDKNSVPKIRTGARCDVDAMKADQGFMNTFVDNRDRYAHYAVFAVVPVTESLILLHDALDQALGITHDMVEGDE